MQNNFLDIMENSTVQSLVLLGYLLLGLLSYTWAFYSQRHKLSRFKESLILSLTCKDSQLRGVQNTYGCLLALVSMDVLNAVSAVAVAAFLLNNNCLFGCVIFSHIWFVSRGTALLLHSITALVSILFLCHPDWGFTLRCIAKLLLLIAYISVPFYFFYYYIILMAVSVYDFVLMVAIVGNIWALLSPKAAAQRRSITLVAVVTCLFICLPNFILDCLVFESLNKRQIDFNYIKISSTIFHLTNFHLFLDGLLCYFVLKLSADDEQAEARQ